MSSTESVAQDVPIRVLSGPTVLIEYAGLRLLTDPTFDEPGEYGYFCGPHPNMVGKIIVSESA